MKTLRELLESPPQKQIECHKCGGKGYINPRGMISSDRCPRCQSYEIGVAGNSGKEWVVDYDKFESQVRLFFS